MTFQKGYKHSEEIKQKLRIARIGRKPNLGKHHTEETKRKMSESHKGNTDGFKKGNIPWIKGKHHTQETIQKFKERLK